MAGPDRASSRRFVAALALAACTATSEGRVGPEELVATLADSVCEQMARCACPTSTELEACRDHVADELAPVLEAPDPGLTYDQACADAMLEAYDTLECRTAAELESAATTCALCKIYHGTKAAGAACDDDEPLLANACAQGLWCWEGVCVDPCATAGEGESCPEVRCGPGLYCRQRVSSENGGPPEVSGTCTRTAAAGEGCVDVACDDGLACSDGVCAPLPGLGQACTADCREGTCVAGSDGTRTCAPRTADGGSCERDDACVSETCDLERGVCAPAQPLVCEFAE